MALPVPPSVPGTFRMAPARTRLGSLLMKASGLLRTKAASISSSDTLAGLNDSAILAAVSPRFTTTLDALGPAVKPVAGVAVAPSPSAAV